MIRGGVETVMGMTMDPTYGPLIMFGLGGVFVEVMKDVSFRVCPVSDVTAERMIESIKSYPLLAGFRGSKPVDKQALMSGLLRLSQIVNDFDDFSEIDINPFIASSRKGESCVVDARFLLRDKAEAK
jgi:acetate---CoA ligase (ADP-forming)